MNVVGRFNWKHGSPRWAVVIGVGIVLCAGTGRPETCTLSPVHREPTFTVERVTPDWACRLQAVIESNTTVTKLGPIRVAMSESVYRYLLNEPPFAAALIRRLGLGAYQSEARGNGRFWGDDGEGTKGIVQLVYEDQTSRLYYLEGAHESRLLPHITGKAVVLLRMAVGRNELGTEDMDSTIVAYAQLDNRFLAGLVSLLHPVIGGIVKNKLQKGVTTVHRLGLIMRQDPHRVLREAELNPPLPEQHLAFLRKVLGAQLDSGQAISPANLIP